MFTSPQNPGEAISAVKAIAKAQQQGQRIYHITQQNMATALPNIHLDANTIDEIKNALAVGKEVTTHTDPVSVPGYTGAGYIIIDPDTGIGAYKIAGGMNGSFMRTVISRIQFVAGMMQSFFKKHPAIAKALKGSFGLIIGTISNVYKLISQCESVSTALILSFLLLLWNVVFLGVNVLLAASGVGAIVIFALSGVEWYLENEFKNWALNHC